MERKTSLYPLFLVLLAGCASKPINYEKPSFDEFSALIFENENYLAMQLPCKAYNPRQQPRQAISCYESVARAHPDSPEAQYLLAMAYLHGGDATGTKRQVLIIEQQSPEFLRLAFHAIARSKRAFKKAFKFEARWLSSS